MKQALGSHEAKTRIEILSQQGLIHYLWVNDALHQKKSAEEKSSALFFYFDAMGLACGVISFGWTAAGLLASTKP